MSTQIKSGKIVVHRPGVLIGDPDPGAVDNLVDESVERLEKLTTRDEEFTARFGKWRRPEHLPRYPIEAWANVHVQWSRVESGILEAADFVLAFPEKTDRVLVGEITRFCAEGVHDEFATDKTLKIFRLDLLRRLDEVGF